MLMHLHAEHERPNAFALACACTEREENHIGRLHRVSPVCEAPRMVAQVQACPDVNLYQTAVIKAVPHRADASVRGA